MKMETMKHDNIGTTALKLLSEVDEICEKNEIQYFLSPGMTLRALRDVDFNEFFIMPGIYMTLDNLLKFIEAVNLEARDGRSLDYLGNNNNYATFNVSYVNTETTFVDVSRGLDFQQFGIKVLINVLRNDIKDRMPAFIETGREANSFKFRKHKSWKTRLVKAFVARQMNSKDEDFGKYLFDYYVKKYAGNPDSERVFIRRFRRKRLYFDRSIFSERRVVEWGERKFYVPGKTEEFLETFFGSKYEEMELKPFTIKKKLVSNTIPFRDYFRVLEQEGLPMEELFDKQSEIRKDKIMNRRLLKAVNNTYRVARMSEDRMIFYKELSEQIDDIRKYHAAEDYEKLEEIFEEYHDRAKYYLKFDLALCPDEELFNIECDLMEYKGSHKKAERMRKCVAEHHKKPLLGRNTDEHISEAE